MPSKYLLIHLLVVREYNILSRYVPKDKQRINCLSHGHHKSFSGIFKKINKPISPPFFFVCLCVFCGGGCCVGRGREL